MINLILFALPLAIVAMAFHILAVYDFSQSRRTPPFWFAEQVD
jgi:hypothetical protein